MSYQTEKAAAIQKYGDYIPDDEFYRLVNLHNKEQSTPAKTFLDSTKYPVPDWAENISVNGYSAASKEDQQKFDQAFPGGRYDNAGYSLQDARDITDSNAAIAKSMADQNKPQAKDISSTVQDAIDWEADNLNKAYTEQVNAVQGEPISYSDSKLDALRGIPGQYFFTPLRNGLAEALGGVAGLGAGLESGITGIKDYATDPNVSLSDVWNKAINKASDMQTDITKQAKQNQGLPG